MPLAPVQQLSADRDITLVRDGCGRGFRFSHSRQACVPIWGAVVHNPAATAAAVAATTAIILGTAAATRHHRHHHHHRHHRHRR